jgi:hypothetical protein
MTFLLTPWWRERRVGNAVCAITAMVHGNDFATREAMQVGVCWMTAGSVHGGCGASHPLH